MSRGVVIIGYSGHAYVVCDALQEMGREVVGYCDQEVKDRNPFKLEYLGSESDDKALAVLKGHDCFVAIGDNAIRERVGTFLKKNTIELTNAVHPSSIISSSAQLGVGVMIGPGTIINAMTTIGDGAICNSGCIIEHECVVGEYAHVCPGSVLCGQVSIGDLTFIGANAVIKQGITIGKNVMVGAGSVVIDDIPDGTKVVGNPAKAI